MATQQKIQSGADGRTAGFEFEDLLESVFNEAKYKDLKITHAKQIVEGSIAPTATNKNDKILQTSGKRWGLSIKNPKTSSTTIQMQIIYKEKLLAQLGTVKPVPQAVSDFFDLFFGGNLEEDCARLGVDYDALEYDNEQRRDRALWDSVPTDLREAFLDYFNDEEIKREVLEVVLKRGVTALDGSDFMVWCDSSVAGKSNPEHLVGFRIDSLIDEICKRYSWEPNYHKGICSAVYLGPINLQMKGSGKGKSYHSPQFRMSLSNAIRLCPKVRMYRGSCLSILPYLPALPK